ncbi:unnamed protein product [Lactuca saligna]|uniref:Uncharacterized protein n=1 Tax=Lactuca saligna TaxID=75948 RepID=A0AA35Y8X4_LACSI|nr:unnamed protein product [Lactuca saligna]
MVLHGHYRGRLYHREVDLVEALPPPVFERRMRELARLLSVEGGNVGSSGPVLPSRLAVGVIFLTHPLNFVHSCLPMGAHVGRVIAPVRKRRNVCVVSSSNEETESNHKNKVVIPDSMMSPPLSITTSSLIDLSSYSRFGSALGSSGGCIQLKKPLAESRIGTAPRS